MGFVNATRGVRAIGYLERDPLPAGPVALVTHSGSVFSAMLRTHRRLEYSARRLVRPGAGHHDAADYLGYALSQPETRVVGLVLETLRDAPGLRGLPGRRPPSATSPWSRSPWAARPAARSSSMPTRARSRARTPPGRRCSRRTACTGPTTSASSSTASSASRSAGGCAGRAGGIATVHDSGAERVLAADVAERLGVPFAPLSEATVDAAVARLLDPGLEPTNPLDVWGTGNGAEDQLSATAWPRWRTTTPSTWSRWRSTWCRSTTATSRSPRRSAGWSSTPTSRSSCCRTSRRRSTNRWPRSCGRAGVPVLEGTRSGLRALGHLRDQATRPTGARHRHRRGAPGALGRRGSSPATSTRSGCSPTTGSRSPPRGRWTRRKSAVAAAETLGYPVVLKTAAPDVHHKLDVDGVRLGLGDAVAVRTAYHEIADRLGPSVVVQPQVAPGIEVALRRLARPAPRPARPDRGRRLARGAAGRALRRPAAVRRRRRPGRWSLACGWRTLLAGHRGRPAGAVDALVDAVVAFSTLAHELGDLLEAVDVNPLVVGPDGVIAVDALVLPRS